MGLLILSRHHYYKKDIPSMATYTELSYDIIKGLLANYDLGELHDVAIMEGGLTNSSAIIHTAGGTYVLSVCDGKNMDEIRQLTSVLGHLNQHHFCTSRLIKTTDGKSYISYEDKPVYIKEYIEGEVEDSLSSTMYFQIGKALAQLHNVPTTSELSQDFPYGIECFPDVLGLDGDYPRWLGEKTTQLQAYLHERLPQGFIHGDLFYDNILFKDGELAAIIDFEEACHYYLVFDIGMCIAGSCCDDKGQLLYTSASALIEGYQSIRKLSNTEKQALQFHIVYAATATSFWRYRQFNIIHPNMGKNDAYLEMMAFANHVYDIDTVKFYQKIFG